MPATLRALHRFEACTGEAVVVGAAVGAPPLAAVGDPALELRALLSVEEGRSGRVVDAVVVRIAGTEDGPWAAEALSWVADHGRRAVLRTPAVLPRDLVACVRRVGATVQLEAAGPDPVLGRALLGPSASPLSSLLLQAQHLAALGIPTAAVAGPLVGGLHDDARLRSLCSHVAGANLTDVHVTVGRMSRHRFEALRAVLPADAARRVARAYGFDPATGPGDVPVRLPPAAHVALHMKARLAAEGYGLSVDACGCPLVCRHDGPRVPVPLAEPELFESAG